MNSQTNITEFEKTRDQEPYGTIKTKSPAESTTFFSKDWKCCPGQVEKYELEDENERSCFEE